MIVIIYEYDSKLWDDLYLLIESDTYQILDIGSPEKTFTQNEALLGKNSNDLSLLAKNFIRTFR